MGGGGAVSSEMAHNSFFAKVAHHFTRLFSVVFNGSFQMFTKMKYHSMIVLKKYLQDTQTLQLNKLEIIGKSN